MSVPTAAVKAASSTDIAGKFAKEGQAKTEASRFSDAPPMQRQLCDLKQQTSPFGFLYDVLILRIAALRACAFSLML